MQHLKQTKDCKEGNKRHKINEIINSYVPRQANWKSQMIPKKQSINCVIDYVRFEEHSDSKIGYDKLVMCGKVFSGNKALMEEAEENGQVWQGEDGKWYYDSSSQNRKETMTRKIQLNSEHDLDEPKRFHAVFAEAVADLQKFDIKGAGWHENVIKIR